MKKVTRIRVERIEVDDDWKQPTPLTVFDFEPTTAVRQRDRIADYYFCDGEDENSEIWPVLFNIKEGDASESIALMGHLFELAGTMLRFSRITKMERGTLKHGDH